MEQSLGYLISFMVAMIVFLLGVIVRQNAKMGEKLDIKVNEATCLERHGNLTKEQEGFWGAINNHSHTGLPQDSRVIR